MIGVDDPVGNFQGKRRDILQQVHVGPIVGVEGADIAPEAGAVGASLGEREGDHLFGIHQTGKYVFAEIMAGAASPGIAADGLHQRGRGKQVYAHVGQAPAGAPGDLGRIGRLFMKAADAHPLVHLHHAETHRLRLRHGNARDGGLGAARGVEVQKLAVVHPVDVVAGEDQHQGGLFALQHVGVLKDGVGGALVPFVGEAHLRRQGDEEFPQRALEEIPPLPQVAFQGLRAVLRQHEDMPDAAVDAVGKGEVYDAVHARERHGRLGAMQGEREQALAGAPREDKGQHVTAHGFPPKRPSGPYETRRRSPARCPR